MARLKLEVVKNYIEEFKGYKLLSDTYINTRTKIMILHEDCGKTFHMDLDHFKRGQRCPHCRKNANTDTSEFKKKIKTKYGVEYSILGEYVNNRTSILTRHNKCGHEWYPRPDNLLEGYRCPKCGGSAAKDTEKFKHEVYMKYKDEYSVLGEYVNSQTGILMIHNKCGHEWKVRPTNFLTHDTQCPKCKSSKGEKKIARWLEENGFKYEQEVCFEECRNKKYLPFDFYIELDDDDFILIEFDGKQHFKPSGMFTEAVVKEIQFRDNIKNKFCKEYGIKLVRIPYTKYKDIDNILLETFNDYRNHIYGWKGVEYTQVGGNGRCPTSFF